MRKTLIQCEESMGPDFPCGQLRSRYVSHAQDAGSNARLNTAGDPVLTFVHIFRRHFTNVRTKGSLELLFTGVLRVRGLLGRRCNMKQTSGTGD